MDDDIDHLRLPQYSSEAIGMVVQWLYTGDFNTEHTTDGDFLSLLTFARTQKLEAMMPQILDWLHTSCTSAGYVPNPKTVESYQSGAVEEDMVDALLVDLYAYHWSGRNAHREDDPDADESSDLDDLTGVGTRFLTQLAERHLKLRQDGYTGDQDNCKCMETARRLVE